MLTYTYPLENASRRFDERMSKAIDYIVQEVKQLYVKDFMKAHG